MARLAASRLTSHSHGPRQGLVEIVEVEDQVALGRGEHAEVAQVGVPAGLDVQSGAGRGGQVRGHDEGRAPVEGERGHQHPAVPDGHQLLHPRHGLALEELHRIGSRRERLPGPLGGPGHFGAGGLAQVDPFLRRQMLEGLLDRPARCRLGLVVGHDTTFPSGRTGAITLIGRYPIHPDGAWPTADRVVQEPATTRNPTLPVELSDELPNRADTR